MSLILRECLTLPSMSFAKVIAGKRGLDRIVSSVSVFEFFDNQNTVNTYSPNELTISSFFCIKDNVEKQCEVIRNLHETGSVALVLFYTGYIVKELSPQLIQTADNLDYPLIILNNNDYSINYSNMITDIMGAILRDQSFSKDLSASIKKRLSEIPFENRTMENLLKIISLQYKCNILLSTGSGIYFDAEYLSFQNFFNPELLFHAFKGDIRGYSCKTLIIDDKPLDIYKMDFLNINNSWMTVYASCFNTKLNKENMITIAKCTDFFSTLWGYSLNLHSKDTLVSLILKSEKNVTKKIAEEQNLSFSSISDIIIVDTEIEYLNDTKNHIKEILNDNNKFFISDIIDNHIVILTSFENEYNSGSLTLYEINNYIENLEYTASVFAHSCKNKDISSIRIIYFDYCKAVSSLRRVFVNKRRWDIHDVTLSKELTDLFDFDSPKRENVMQIIELLGSYDEELLDTMATYFIDCDSQLAKTALQLSIHRNTLSYRINKIKELTHTDFTLLPAAYQYYTAAAMWRLMKTNP